MAKKVFLYDSYGYDFYACEFDGLDAEGKPRLTIMTPGCPVENFLESSDIMNDPRGYYLLCEEGKTADSEQVVEMLMQIFMNGNHPYERMIQRMEMMRKWGISYGCELQRLTVMISECKNEETQRISYLLDLKVGGRFAENTNEFKDVKDIIAKLSGFFFYIQNHVHIPLWKCLEVSESVKKQVMRHTTHMFDEIETI
jgi:hypothetical protein